MSRCAAALSLLALLAHGQTDRVEQYRKELEQNRNSSEAHFWLGVSFIEQKQWQPAANELREALNFEVDEHGVPRRFPIDAGTLPGFGEDAIAFLRSWRFTPGVKDGAAIAVPCKVDFVWGL